MNNAKRLTWIRETFLQDVDGVDKVDCGSFPSKSNLNFEKDAAVSKSLSQLFIGISFHNSYHW